MRKVTDLLPTEAILISSEAERDGVLKLMDEAGWLWNSGDRAIHYNEFQEYPYGISYKGDGNEGIARASLGFYKSLGLTILPASYFIPTEAEKVEVCESKPFKIRAYRKDAFDEEAFAAYLSPSIKQEEHGIVVLDIEGMIVTCINEDVSFKEMLVETIGHEVLHALEEWFDLEFSEERVDKILNTYIAKYNKENE